MDVLACDRSGCENIMCDRRSRKYGYICWECFEELVEKGANADIQDFMYSRKREENAAEDAYEKFNEEFVHRGDDGF